MSDIISNGIADDLFSLVTDQAEILVQSRELEIFKSISEIESVI